MKRYMKEFFALAAAMLAVSAMRADNLEVDGGQYVEVVDNPATVGEVRLGTTQNNPNRAVLVLKPTGTFEFTDRFRVGYESGTYGSVTQECGTVLIRKGGEAQNAIGYAAGSTEWSEYVICQGAYLDGWTDGDGRDYGFDVGRHGYGRLIVDGGTYKGYLDLRIGVESDGKGELIVKNGGTFELHYNGGYPNPIKAARSGSRVVVTGAGSTITVSDYIMLRRFAELHIDDGGRVTVPFICGEDDPGMIYANGGILAYDNRTPKCGSNDFAKRPAAINGYLIDGVAALYIGEGGLTVDIPEGSEILLHQAMLKDPALGDAVCGDFVKTGGGTLTLAADNTFDGRVVVKGGILVIPNDAAIDPTKIVEDGGTAQIDNEYVATYASSTTIGADAVADLVAAVDTARATALRFEVAAEAVVTVDASISLPTGVGFAKAGDGTLVLNAANSWDGETLLEGGLLVASLGTGVPVTSHVKMAGGTWGSSGRLALQFGSGAGQLSIGANGCNFAAVGDDLELVFNPDGNGDPVDVEYSSFSGCLYLNYAAGDHTLKVMNKIRGGGEVYSNNATVDFVGGVNTGSDLHLFGSGRIVFSGPMDLVYSLKWNDSIDVVLTNDYKKINGQMIDKSSGTATLYSCSGDYRCGDLEIANYEHSGSYVSTFVVEEGVDFTVNNWWRAGRRADSTGILRINGGSLTMKSAGNSCHIGYDQNNSTGIVDVVSGAITNAGVVYLGGAPYNGGNKIVGILDLKGGEFVAPQLCAYNDTENVKSILRFNGGKLVVSSDQQEFLKWVDEVDVGAAGGTIDIGTHDVSLALDEAGMKLGGCLTKTGSGTLSTSWLPFGDGGALEIGGGSVKVPAGYAPGVIPPGGDATPKLFRFSVKRSRNGGHVQMSEFSLYDAGGNRLNLGLKKSEDGTAAEDLAQGTYSQVGQYTYYYSEGVEKAFDGDLNSKWNPDGDVNDESNEAKWRVLAVRLPDEANPVASMSFTTGNDDTPGRNPHIWTLEASPNGGRDWYVVASGNQTGDVPTELKTESERFAVDFTGVPDRQDIVSRTLSFADGGKLVCDGDLDLSNVVLTFRDHTVPTDYFASHSPRRWTIVESTGTLTVGPSTIPRGTSRYGYSYFVTEHAVMVDCPSGLSILIR